MFDFPGFMDFDDEEDGAGKGDAPRRPAYLTPVRPLPPWYRPSLPPGKTFGQLIREVAKGEFYGLEFPVTAAMLQAPEWGAAWLTRAFRAAGTLPSDNEVASVVVQDIPMNSNEMSGGAARKCLLTVEYAKEDPDLHRELFCKLPLREEDNINQRMNLSCFGDPDGAEVSAYQFLVHLLPVRVPKMYFCDLARTTTNFIIVTERVLFAERGAELRPHVIHPAVGKCGDHELEDPAAPYYAIFRAVGRMVAADKTGRLDSVKEIFEETSYARFGGRAKYLAEQRAAAGRTPEQREAAGAAARKKAELAAGRQLKALPGELQMLGYFVSDVAPWLFPGDCREEAFLGGLAPKLELIVKHAADVAAYCTEDPALTGLIHPNPEIDNAYFWHDDDGNCECGLFDWGGVGYQPYTRLFHGTIRYALAEVVLEHEERWFRCFTEEVRRHGGPDIDHRACLLISRLMFATQLVPGIGKSLGGSLAFTTVNEWRTITHKSDDRIMKRLGVRVPVLGALQHLTIWRRGPHWQVFLDFCKGRGYVAEPPGQRDGGPPE